MFLTTTTLGVALTLSLLLVLLIQLVTYLDGLTRRKGHQH